MDEDDCIVGNEALQVQLELDLTHQPITGRLRSEQGDDETFVGWLGFVEALRHLTDAATNGHRDPT